MDFKFDHEKGSVREACGLKKEEMNELVERVNTIGRTCDSVSEIIEKLGDNFTSHELAFVMESCNGPHQNEPMDPIMRLMEKLSQA